MEGIQKFCKKNLSAFHHKALRNLEQILNQNISGLLSKEDQIPEIKKRKPLRLENSEEISEDEAQNFLKILSVLLLNNKVETEKEETGDSVDGITDVVVFTATRLSELLQCDINSLALPKTLKKVLKLLKAITNFLKSKDILEAFKDA